MEADWEIELGADAPIIDALWPGFVDLRVAPERVAEIAETRLLPGLSDVLVQLNGPRSSVWTAKCDVWNVEEPVDRYEVDVEPGETAAAMACYIDLLPRDAHQWVTPAQAGSACEALIRRLRAIEARACRVDFVVRAAHIRAGAQDLGITAYVTGVGRDEPAASAQLATAAAALGDTLLAPRMGGNSGSPVQ
ncbi:MAG: hypothetical protein P4L40_08875 [Terracidiphilus sp.]|nr:hypothetical protein [Terracidiphilus sp.]